MRPPCNPKIPFPEVRDLVRLARAYLAGEVHFSEVCSATWVFRDAARYFSADPVIQQMASEWYEMALRAWPEMLPVDDPITEPEFRSWVQSQLVVFEPGEFASNAPPA